ncbi:hypothetical protein [Microbulbifer rhizosphaerae]|uniref:Uncharacterized protein n=1 Tax=Microbulbifer rhizosphaerae TaxID=1562603 RepID=A0A7W4WAY1_9GAMM|nr:hypothetical protein [Microbulbifer rhizosphaerae]MBB3060353.1 hypothetical protein [Microbulbifer rhizosphaerae]
MRHRVSPFYQQLSGGEQPAYIVMIPRENYAFFAFGKAVHWPDWLN